MFRVYNFGLEVSGFAIWVFGFGVWGLGFWGCQKIEDFLQGF